MGNVKLTPGTTEGPYYKENSPEKTNLREKGVPGENLVLTGYVRNTDNKPVAGAWLDFWQANGDGRYDNTGYVLRGHQFSDKSGKYHLETVMPGGYVGRTPHIHVKVKAPGSLITLTTQLFIPKRDTNESDPIFRDDLLVSMSPTAMGQLATFNFIINL
jgi:protocatechuate 3,4-dioxygenase beta subunit